MKCRLCSSSDLLNYSTIYYQCLKCSMIQQDQETFLAVVDEHERYKQHNNDSEDIRYVNYLKHITEPMLKFLNPEMIGLDYGCGPGPTISKILAEHGINCLNYDPLFHDDKSLLEGRYDFIFSTEVFEHFHHPAQELEKIWKMLKAGGRLAVMTVFFPSEKNDFKAWWYKNDPTHVCFYNEAVFEFIAKKYNAKIEILSNKAVVLTKE